MINFQKKTVFFLVFLLALSLGIFPFISKEHQQRIINMVCINQSDPTVQKRLPMWIMAFEGFKESPIFGHALRGFREYNEKYLSMHYEELKARNKYTMKKSMSHPHNMHLAALFSWGIVGVLLLALTTVIAIRQSIVMGQYLPIYAIVFMLAYGLFEVRFQSKTGDLFLFFPIGMAFSSLLSWKKQESIPQDVP